MGCEIVDLRPKLMFEFIDEAKLIEVPFEPAAATSSENFVFDGSVDLATDGSRLVEQQTHAFLSASFETRQIEHVHFDDFDFESV